MRPEDLLKVPAWLETHPELQRRGIVLSECLKPSFVYRTSRTEKPVRVVKILEDDEQEAAIYQRLQRDPARTDRRNPAIPCEIIRSEGLRGILLMPSLLQLDDIDILQWSLSRLLEVFLQVVEGVEFLHEQHIAHLDICNGNTVVATENEARADSRVVAGKVYIIDFQTSQHLRLGPGEQPAIRISYAQIPRPRDLDFFDPYSWDVYCLGQLLVRMTKVNMYIVSHDGVITFVSYSTSIGNDRHPGSFAASSAG